MNPGALKARYSEKLMEAGCDEAGRGCLAGPVVAAAVILPIDFDHPLLNDSKKITAKDRNLMRGIIESNAIDYAVAFVDNSTIDRINILNASILAMHQALDKLRHKPEFIIVDGNRFQTWNNVPHQTIVKGDNLYRSIAAASILAKTYRDEFMVRISADYPQFQWNKNKGYPTNEHRDAIRKYGISPFHRKSFHLFDPQLFIQFPE
ncbi:MAG TPA: ribonuclease HII [Salinivirgaceae bacterium]|nr:ribonuclease HII [Salinivirgaceae bacterium]